MISLPSNFPNLSLLLNILPIPLPQVLRLDRSGRARQVFARRRDLLKEHRLQPRDLRRIDPSVDINKTPPSITIKDNVILLCMGGVR